MDIHSPIRQRRGIQNISLENLEALFPFSSRWTEGPISDSGDSGGQDVEADRETQAQRALSLLHRHTVPSKYTHIPFPASPARSQSPADTRCRSDTEATTWQFQSKRPELTTKIWSFASSRNLFGRLENVVHHQLDSTARCLSHAKQHHVLHSRRDDSGITPCLDLRAGV